MKVGTGPGTDPAEAIYDAIKASNDMRPAAFSPFYIWFGPTKPPEGYRRLGVELSHVRMYVKAMPGYEHLLVEQEGLSPPPGYFRPGANDDKEPHYGFWDVSNRLLVSVSPDGSSMPPMGRMFFDPGVWGFPENHALQLGHCFLPVPDCPVPEPTFDPTYGPGQATPAGVRRVVVLFKTVNEDFYGKIVPSGDFLYLANQAAWVLQNTASSPEGGSEDVNITVGFSQFDSETFYKYTKIETSVDVGVLARMFSFGFSTDVSDEMSVTKIHNENHSSEVTVNVRVQFPKSDLTQFWQGFCTIVLYDSDGTIVSQATNMTRDSRLTWHDKTTGRHRSSRPSLGEGMESLVPGTGGES